MNQSTQLLEKVQQPSCRRRGEGRIWRRGRIWWIKYYVHGRPVCESSHSDRRAVGERLLRQRLGEAAAGIAAPPRAARVSYEEIRDALLADYTVNKRKWIQEGKDGNPYMTAHLDRFFSGMRRGEILGLRWANADFFAGEIRLDPGTTKNDEPRTIPLAGQLLEMLKIEREKNPGAEFVFTRNGQRIGTFWKAWKSACKRAGLQGLLFHDLRRTGVRNLVRAGVPERVAMAISGHKTRAIFERYNIVSGRDLKDAARKLETYLAKQNGDKTGTIQAQFAKSPQLIH